MDCGVDVKEGEEEEEEVSGCQAPHKLLADARTGCRIPAVMEATTCMSTTGPHLDGNNTNAEYVGLSMEYEGKRKLLQ